MTCQDIINFGASSGSDLIFHTVPMYFSIPVYYPFEMSKTRGSELVVGSVLLEGLV
jgi:hypothetical protein